jgi:hypothetical protein
MTKRGQRNEWTKGEICSAGWVVLTDDAHKCSVDVGRRIGAMRRASETREGRDWKVRNDV